MAQDRYMALAAWRALSPERRRAAWRAAAKPTPIEDQDLAAVVARYAVAMRGQVPAGVLRGAPAAPFGWVAGGGYPCPKGRARPGVGGAPPRAHARPAAAGARPGGPARL